MATVNYVNTVQVGTDVDTASVGLTLSQLGQTKGQLALVEKNTLTALDATAAGNLSVNDTVYVARGNGDGTWSLSEPIFGKSVQRYAGSPYVAPQQKTLSIGGVAQGGTSAYSWINAQPEKGYRLTVLMKDDQRPHGQKQTREAYDYTTKTTTSDADVAFAIASLFEARKQNGTDKKYGGRYVELSVIASNTFTTNADNAATVSKGSKVLVFATAATYSTGSAIAVGDVIQANTKNSNGGNSYVNHLVVNVDGLNVTLDTPVGNIEGDSGGVGTWAAADIEVIPEASVDTYGYGFEIRSLIPIDDWNGIDTYEVADFEASFYDLSDAGNDGAEAEVILASQIMPGTGTGYQIHDKEFFAQGYAGLNSRTRWYDNMINPATTADLTAAYNQITIVFTASSMVEFQATETMPKMANIALFDGGSNNQNANFAAILDAYFNGVLGFPAIGTL